MHTVGIDVGKRKHVAQALDPAGQPVGKPLAFANVRAGFDRLLAYLSQLDGAATVGLEATGH